MIYLLILIDILINNYTKYTTYFFIVGLYNKSFKYFLITGLILDLVIYNSFFINTIILIIIFILNKIFKGLNKRNIANYIFINLFNYILFIILSNIIIINTPTNILINIGENLFINLTFYLLSFRIEHSN